MVALAPTITSGALAEGGTFISARTERRPDTRSISQLISSAEGCVVVGRLRPGCVAGQPGVRPGKMLPELLGHERHERMQQFNGFRQHMGRAGPRFRLGTLVVAIEHRLEQLQIPVAELVQTNR